MKNLKVGSVHNITWTDIIDTSAVNIQLTIDNEDTWSYITSSVPNDDTYGVYNSYSWTVTETVSDLCKFKITSNADSELYVLSNLFIITSGTSSNVTVNAIIDGESVSIVKTNKNGLNNYILYIDSITSEFKLKTKFSDILATSATIQ